MGLINKKVPKKPVTNKKVPKKPNVKPIVNTTVEQTEQQIEEQVIEQTVELIVEQVVEPSIDNTDKNIETNTDVNEDEKNDVCVAEDLQEEEKSESENKEEEIIPIEKLETVKEKEKKTTKKKTTKKTKAQDTDINIDDIINDFNEATEYLKDVISFSSKEWEEEKTEIQNKVQSLCISTDLNPDSAKKLISQMSETYTSLSNRLEDNKRQCMAVEKKIKDIKIENAIGANKQERDMNALKAVKYYKKNSSSKALDLELYFNAIQDKVRFFESQKDIIDKNRQMLITFSGLFKIEINNY